MISCSQNLLLCTPSPPLPSTVSSLVRHHDSFSNFSLSPCWNERHIHRVQVSACVCAPLGPDSSGTLVPPVHAGRLFMCVSVLAHYCAQEWHGCVCSWLVCQSHFGWTLPRQIHTSAVIKRGRNIQATFYSDVPNKTQSESRLQNHWGKLLLTNIHANLFHSKTNYSH